MADLLIWIFALGAFAASCIFTVRAIDAGKPPHLPFVAMFILALILGGN